MVVLKQRHGIQEREGSSTYRQTIRQVTDEQRVPLHCFVELRIAGREPGIVAWVQPVGRSRHRLDESQRRRRRIRVW